MTTDQRIHPSSAFVDRRPRWNSTTATTGPSPPRQLNSSRGVNMNSTGGTYRSREERLEEMRKRSEMDRERKLREIKANEEREKVVRAQKEAERQKHFRDLKAREEQRLKAAEERRKALDRVAEEKRAATLAKFNDHLGRINELNRHARPIYAFGSSTPRAMSYLQKVTTPDQVYSPPLKATADKRESPHGELVKKAHHQSSLMTRSVKVEKPVVLHRETPAAVVRTTRMAKSLVVVETSPPIQPRIKPTAFRSVPTAPKPLVVRQSQGKSPTASKPRTNVAKVESAQKPPTLRKRMIRTESYTKLSPTQSKTVVVVVEDISVNDNLPTLLPTVTVSPAAVTTPISSVPRVASEELELQESLRLEDDSNLVKGESTVGNDSVPTVPPTETISSAPDTMSIPSIPHVAVDLQEQLRLEDDSNLVMEKPTVGTDHVHMVPPTETVSPTPNMMSISSIPHVVVDLQEQLQREDDSNLIDSTDDVIVEIKVEQLSPTVSPFVLQPDYDGLMSLSSSEETLENVTEIPTEDFSDSDVSETQVNPVVVMTPSEGSPVQQLVSSSLEPTVLSDNESVDIGQLKSPVFSPTVEPSIELIIPVDSASPIISAERSISPAALNRSVGVTKTLTTEDEAKAALAERRRFAREEMERQKELERQREAEEGRLAELQRQREEEEFLRAEQEAMELLALRNAEEQARLDRAIEEALRVKELEEKRVEAERAKQEEMERRVAEAEKKADAERLEREEKSRREEEERLERKKRLEAVMSRTRKSAGGGSGTITPPDTKTTEKGSAGVLLPEDSKSSAIPLNHSSGILAKIISERPEMQKSLNILNRVRSSPNTNQTKTEDIMTKSVSNPPNVDKDDQIPSRLSASVGFSLDDFDSFEASPWSNDLIPDTTQSSWDQFDSSFTGGITSLPMSNGNVIGHQQYNGTWGVAVMPVRSDPFGSHDVDFQVQQRLAYQQSSLPGVVPEFPDLIPTKLRPTIATHDSGIEADLVSRVDNVRTEKLLDL